ncbi:hypothetical protein E3Q10_03067 [Wallemia mellicola]|uniref:Uncharacterized protein n=1 Tax=Wallemia mellicola TaxID=1708541 RepID=A0A4T0QU26_9BASI|nr:hypothetical protein E3Q14_03177 [Wallemia mellicola]TIC28562.1 hypothetical protein E3Q10_03067 [Wallemia mellicola]TIC66695.1 hypothetical protein E3Q01_01633 [Wallemia mellicola]
MRASFIFYIVLSAVAFEVISARYHGEERIAHRRQFKDTKRQRQGGNNNTGAGVGGNANNNNNEDPQTSLRLDPDLVMPGLAQDGQQAGAEAGQVASLTSTNNFINFCLTEPALPLTNGMQVRGGSCNPVPIGVVAATNKMPSAKFVNPKNGDTIPANQDFTIQMAVRNIDTGNFVNPNTNYFAAPVCLAGISNATNLIQQTTNNNGIIVGHSHVVVEELPNLETTQPLDPTNFAFFKGLNEEAQNGVLTAQVSKGLPAGDYRMCSINSSANHQPVIVAVAQHGSLDDCSYHASNNIQFTVQ